MCDAQFYLSNPPQSLLHTVTNTINTIHLKPIQNIVSVVMQCALLLSTDIMPYEARNIYVHFRELNMLHY